MSIRFPAKIVMAPNQPEKNVLVTLQDGQWAIESDTADFMITREKVLNWSERDINPPRKRNKQARFLHKSKAYPYLEVPYPWWKENRVKFGHQHLQHLEKDYTQWLTLLFILLVAGVTALIISFYAFGGKLFGNLLTKVVSTQQEEAWLGPVIEPELEKGLKVNNQATAHMRELLKDWKWTGWHKTPDVYVIEDTSVVNAAALPAGKMLVFAGLIKRVNRVEELEGIMAHEFAHLRMRHPFKGIVRSLTGWGLVQVLSQVGFPQIFVSQADILSTATYSRQLETEADMQAINILEENNLSPYGIIMGLERLRQYEIEQIGSTTQNGIAKLYNTHPELLQRIEYLKEQVNNRAYIAKESPAKDSLFQKLKASVE